ncbi:MAG: hypothetical protein Q7J07_00735 [Pelolinea sp.]|nr:hypothetical protein [Pelolinea sp.]
MPDTINRFSLVKPTVDTPFHIDFSWWQETDSNWRVFLFSFLCEKHQEDFADKSDSFKIDAVDPETAEIRPVDGLLHTLMNHCAQTEDFIPANLPLIERIFRTFLANGNEPLSPQQLSDTIDRPAKTILVTIGGHQVYKGIRPLQHK